MKKSKLFLRPARSVHVIKAFHKIRGIDFYVMNQREKCIIIRRKAAGFAETAGWLLACHKLNYIHIIIWLGKTREAVRAPHPTRTICERALCSSNNADGWYCRVKLIFMSRRNYTWIVRKYRTLFIDSHLGKIDECVGGANETGAKELQFNGRCGGAAMILVNPCVLCEKAASASDFACAFTNHTRPSNYGIHQQLCWRKINRFEYSFGIIRFHRRRYPST